MSETAAGMVPESGRQTGGSATDPATLESDLFSPRPNGPAVAALLAGAAGVFLLGLITFIDAAAEGVHEWMQFQNRVGALSGKTTMTGVTWLVVWAILSVVLWRRNVRLEWVWAIVIVLLVAGNLLMVPPIFQRVEPG